MREELARLVHPVLAAGLGLKERLERGEAPALEAEQAALTGLLLSDRDAARLPDFGGDRPDDQGSVAAFLGVRYALACWLDEMFVLGSPWAERWNEHKLEVQLYASNERAWKFWDQARLAAGRPTADTLEAFFLCVMLGFSGELGEEPERLREWIATTRQHLSQARAREWPTPPAREPVTRVPPLTGRARLRTMLLVAAATLLALVPLVAFVLARQLS
jgi:type IV/VI secretion system ImpK/VasF family protein